MNRVTINDLAWDYKHNTMQKELIESCDIEVVPRKMVEMIIERGKELEDYYTDCECYSYNDEHYTRGRVASAYDIREYAESLLKQFEEDKEDEH